MVLNSKNWPFYILKPEVEWNQLLNYIGADRTNDPAFKAKLEKILQTKDHPKYDEAQKLNERLQSFWRKLVF